MQKNKLQNTCHLFSKAVDVISLVEVSDSICPDAWLVLFVTIAVHTWIMDWIPLYLTKLLCWFEIVKTEVLCPLKWKTEV